MEIKYPYLPEGREIKYVDESNPFMAAAKEFARQNNTVRHIHAAVIVKDGKIIARGSIGAGFHGAHGGCIREKLNVPTGTRYDLCEGCGYQYHSEASALRDASEHNQDTRGADLYLWGHWWCCEPCWKVMIEAGIKDVYVLEGGERFFEKSHKDNILGKQFQI